MTLHSFPLLSVVLLVLLVGCSTSEADPRLKAIEAAMEAKEDQ